MSLWRALRKGITAATCISAPLVLFFVVYLVAALVLTLPVAAALSSWLGHRLAANDMARDFDGLLLVEPVLNSNAMLQVGQITPGAQAEGRAAATTLLAMGATVLVAGLLGALLNVVLGGALLTCVEGTRNIFQALGRAVAFAVRQPGRALGLYLLMTALGLVLVPLYSGLIAPLVPFSWGVAAIAMQQLYIIARLWTRLAGWASQVALYRQGIGA